MPTTPEMRHVPTAIFSSGIISERAWKVPAVIAPHLCCCLPLTMRPLTKSRASLHYAVTLLLDISYLLEMSIISYTRSPGSFEFVYAPTT